MSESFWIGVDLDATLAEYHGWVSAGEIGKPVPAMLERVKTWLAEGKDVRIFTARVAGDGTWKREQEIQQFRFALNNWCLLHLGRTLPVTNTKDMRMIEIWDDRAVQVEPNTGRRMDGR